MIDGGLITADEITAGSNFSAGNDNFYAGVKGHEIRVQEDGVHFGSGNTYVTVDNAGTTFANTDSGVQTSTTINGNQISGSAVVGQDTISSVELVAKDENGNVTNSVKVDSEGTTVSGPLNVKGDAAVDGTLAVGNGLNVNGGASINGGVSITGGLTVDGVDISGSVADVSANVDQNKTAISGIKDQIGVGEGQTVSNSLTNKGETIVAGINKNTDAIGDVSTLKGTNANGEKYTNLTAAVNDNYDRIEQNKTAIAQNSQAISSLGNRVSDLGDEIDNVGAISAALAGLHPLDYDGTGSKFQISAAVGTYDGSQAAALGAFYHFNRDVMLSLGGATAFDGDQKTAANLGVTFRIGEGASGKAVSDDVMARLEAMDQKIAALEQENKDLKNVLGAIDTSLSKEFPDVPANHWAYEAVTKLAGNDVVAGYPDGEFHGDRTMTRYEMAEIIYKAMSKGVQVDQKLVEEFKPEMEQVAANQNA